MQFPPTYTHIHVNDISTNSIYVKINGASIMFSIAAELKREAWKQT